MHVRLTKDQNWQFNSQKSLHKSRAMSVFAAQRKKFDQDQKEKKHAIKKLETAIQQQTNKTIKKLKARGVLACKKEKIRKKTYAELLSKREYFPIGIEISIWDPEKNPTEKK